MISATASRSSIPSAAEPGSDYVATDGHYLSIAGRILAVLREGKTLVLATGDPPADLHRLCEALRKLGEGRRVVIGIPCGPELTPGELFRTGSVVTALPVGGGAAVTEGPEPALPLFVFDDVGQLSDSQIAKVCEAARDGARCGTAGVLLAHLGFLARLEKPPLRPLKEALAQLSFGEIGRDEAIEFLRHQLAARHLREEERGIRPGFLRVLAGSVVLLAIGVGGFLLLHQNNILSNPPSDFSATSSPNGEASMPRSTDTQTISTARDKEPATEAPAPSASIVAPLATARQPEPIVPLVSPPAAQGPSTPNEPSPTARMPQPTASGTERNSLGRETSPGAASSPTRSPGNEGASQAEITVLVTRGDGFLKAGDVASARLFYERAAELGDGAAALRLAATFDPRFLSRAGVRGTPADPAQASLWYRRARDLGEAAAEERLKTLGQQPRGDPGAPAR